MTEHDRIIFDEWKKALLMASKLREVKDLRDEQQLGIALRHAGYGLPEIERHLSDAIEIERDRRAVARLTGGDHDAVLF